MMLYFSYFCNECYQSQTFTNTIKVSKSKHSNHRAA